jgi:hypothetical protein
LNHIAVIGETVADAFVSPDPIPGTLDLHVRPGGGPANTAVAPSRLGVPTRFVGRIPHGPMGALLRTYLSESGVDSATPPTLPNPPVGLRAITWHPYPHTPLRGRAVVRGQFVVDGQMLDQPGDGQQAAHLRAGPQEDDSRA